MIFPKHAANKWNICVSIDVIDEWCVVFIMIILKWQYAWIKRLSIAALLTDIKKMCWKKFYQKMTIKEKKSTKSVVKLCVTFKFVLNIVKLRLWYISSTFELTTMCYMIQQTIFPSWSLDSVYNYLTSVRSFSNLLILFVLWLVFFPLLLHAVCMFWNRKKFMG